MLESQSEVELESKSRLKSMARTQGKSFVGRSMSKSVGILGMPKMRMLKQKKIEDTCMKRVLRFLFGYSDENKKEMVTITQKRIDYMKEQIKLVNTVSAVIVFASILTSYYENEEFSRNKNKSNDTTNLLRFVCVALSILLAFLIFVDYSLRLQLEKLQMRRLQEDNFITSKYIYLLIFEIVFSLITCPPYVDTVFHGRQLKGSFVYSLDSLIFVASLSKAYIFLKVWIQYSMWTSDYAQKVCKKYKVQADIMFALKSELKYRPVLFLSMVALVTIFILGFAIRIFEKYGLDRIMLVRTSWTARWCSRSHATSRRKDRMAWSVLRTCSSLDSTSSS